MNISFFHQAHLNNWHSFQASLRGEGEAQQWDIVVLTAANTKQAAAYRYQLERRHELDMLPGSTEFHVIPDPEGSRVGSAGATLNVLKQLLPPAKGMTADAFFAEQRILILHSGGDSKRLPQHSAFGKIFAPIPRLLASGRPSTLFDELFVALSGLPAIMSPGIVIASGDVLLLFDHSQLDLVRPGFTGIAIAAPIETATRHGVYVAGTSGNVEAFLHKPSVETLRQYAAVSESGTVSVDTGIVFFGSDCAAKLHDKSCGIDSWLSKASNGNAALNFYGDILLPLAPNETFDRYLNDTSDGPATPPLQEIRRDIWHLLRGTPFFVETLSPAKFLHFGTTREYQRLLTYDDSDIRALGGRRRISHVLAPDVAISENACILHSSVAEHSTVDEGAVVEFSALGARCHISKNSIVSGLNLPADAVVPAETVAHGLAVKTAGTESLQYVVRLWGLDDNPKAAMPKATLFGVPLEEWMRHANVSADDLWETGTAINDRTLWTARLYPAAETPDSAWRAVEWMMNVRATMTGHNPAPAEWLERHRFSLHTSYEVADLQAVGDWRRKLFARLVLGKCKSLFDDEVPVAEWFEKIPTLRDLDELLDLMADKAREITPGLVKLRWLFSMGELISLTSAKKTPRSRTARHYADMAFQTLAGCMAAAKAAHASVSKVTTWQRDSVSLNLPVRIDLAGGWSDTPPFTLEHGGTVLNAAILLNAGFPLAVTVERIPEPVIQLRSSDLAMSRTYATLEGLAAYTDPRDPLAIHKAAFMLTCVPDSCTLTLAELCAQLGGGVRISTEVRLPKGTGLGVSSILAAGLAKALFLAGSAEGDEPSLTEQFDAASLIEQMLTTGGGWQDQVGGLVPGLKITTSMPGEYQRLKVSPLELAPDLCKEFDERLLILDTGQRRLAKNLLREVMGRWLARETRTVSILAEIQDIARSMAQALAAGEFSTAGALMWHHWELNKQLDQQTSNQFIDQLMTALTPCVEGAKLAGAGGGGFLLGIMKAGMREQVHEILATEFAGTNIKLYPAHVLWNA